MRISWLRRGEVRAADHLDILRGVVTAGLVLSISVPMADLPMFLRGAAMILAGRALTAGAVRTEAAGRRHVGPWAVRISVVWVATFMPVAFLPNPDAVRSCTAAAGLTLALSSVPRRIVWVLAGALLIASHLLSRYPALPGSLGNLEYALGASWPRGWHDVALVPGLFLVGGLWARAGGSPSRSTSEARPAPRWLSPLCALGRLPIAALLVHSLAVSALAASGAELSPLGILGGSLALLLGEMILAERWLRFRRF